MVTVLLVVLALAVVVLGLALLDRIAVSVAEEKASQLMARPFGHPPLVQVRGTPFLNQAVRGRYRDVTIAGGGLRLGEMTGATLSARISNAYLPFRDLVRRQAWEVPVQRVEGEVLVPYGELARVSRIPYLVLEYDGGRLVASAALPVPGISALARISGEALLTIVGSGAVWLRLGGISVAGITLPRLVLDQLLGTLSVPIPMPELPYGVRLTELRATPDGLLVCGCADAAVLRRATFVDVAGLEPGDARAG